MPEITAKLRLKKPFGYETVSRDKYNENLDLLDQNAASQAQVDQPFYLKSAVYDPSGNKIDLTFGPGEAHFVGAHVSKEVDTIFPIAFPDPDKDYFIYIKKDGTYINNTNGGEIAEAVRIWKVTTGNPVSTITKTDMRGQLPGAGAIEAYNVTTNINGRPISSIFESDGVTVKTASRVVTCTSDPASPAVGQIWLRTDI